MQNIEQHNSQSSIFEISDVSDMSVSQVSELLKDAFKNADEPAVNRIGQIVEADGRKGVVSAFNKLKRQYDAKCNEMQRVGKLYDFQDAIAGMPNSCIIGLDEVGRGPVAGPVTVGGVVLPKDPKILYLNDSKKLSASKRQEIAQTIKDVAVCYKVVSIPAVSIDNLGISECLKRAFKSVIKEVEDSGIHLDLVLLDGNPMYVDKREVNVIKGDGKCASIAAASILAKVTRDEYMVNMAQKYPQYGFDSNKGYGTKDHVDAIKEYGLCPLHRKSFCMNFMQRTLF